MLLRLGLLLGLTLAALSSSGPRRHTVALAQFQFVPRVIHVAVGDTIVWENRDIVPHTATAGDKIFDSGDIPAKARRATAMLKKGEHTITCLYHSNMKGTVVVD